MPQLPAVGHGAGPAAGTAGHRARRDLLRRAHHVLEYQGGKYINLNSYAAAGRPVPARQRAGAAGARAATPATSTRPATRCPETMFSGKGQAMLFHNGQRRARHLERSRWTRRSRCSTAAGPLKVPAGHTWIELVPPTRRRQRSPSASSVSRGRASRRVRLAPGVERGVGRTAVMPCSASERRPVEDERDRRLDLGAGLDGSSADDTLSPAADMAPKKIRLKVCIMLVELVGGSSTEPTMSWTMP